MVTEEAQSIAILGRQPALGRAELESLYGADAIMPFSDQAALLSIAPENIDFNRLGGSIRTAKITATLPSNKWNDIERYLIEHTPKLAELNEGKLSFGISVFGCKTHARAVAKTALLVKKAIKSSGHSVRMVPHKDTALGSAVVLHNKLAQPGNWELLIVSDGTTTYLAQTTNIQDIDAYSARDQARPMRDAKVGMLPPKLAQILVNLATSDTAPSNGSVVLDPFCGTGVLLQEASLMGFDVRGSDIDERMVEFTDKNLMWLLDLPKNRIQRPAESQNDPKWRYFMLEKADATAHTWTPAPTHVAAETFLGHPLSALPSGEHLSKIIYEANVINHRFLQNIAAQLKPGTRLALGVPTWKGRHEFLHLPLLDHLTDMGYTRIRFEHASNEDLIYHRENQVVGRELLVLEKK